MKFSGLCIVIVTGFCICGCAAEQYLPAGWEAKWIGHPSAEPMEYGVYYFRKQFNLDKVPTEFHICVSADNRYRLFVNGQLVGFGPALGDIRHWKYDTYDIASNLRASKNLVAAKVWNFGKYRGAGQVSARTALIFQSGNSSELNSDSSWKVKKCEAYSPIEVKSGVDTRGGFIANPCDRVDGRGLEWGFEQIDFDDGGWQDAIKLDGKDAPWWLIPRDIPMLETVKEPLEKVRTIDGLQFDCSSFSDKLQLNVPANSNVTILLDNGHLTTGFPELIVSGGKDTRVKISYAECLYLTGQTDGEGKSKGHRDSIEGKEFVGYHDLFICDGGAGRLYRPLWFRTYRYVQIQIETAGESLTIEDYYGVFTAYPFKQNACFKSDNDMLGKIWQTGWRTARLCAWETYMDCPYYEQLQYVGDTRIQALVSLYVSGDDRLMRNAIEQFHNSMTSEGLTRCAYPAKSATIIPPYSLFWIGMLHDFRMHRDDGDFVKRYLDGAKRILTWHEQYIDETTDMLGEVPHWNFVDWPDEWAWDAKRNTGGMPAGAETGNSSILTLQYAYILRLAAELFDSYQMSDEAGHYRSLAERLAKGTYRHCWDEKRALVADTPKRDIFSQHANVMAVLAGAIPADDQKEVMRKTVLDRSLIQCTVYYRFYLNRALAKAGLGELYLQTLGPWEKMLQLGLTTFAERPEPTRSDCHAWSASPNYDLLAIVCGINPSCVGFAKVRIEPHIGKLSRVQGEMPHHLGTIKVDYRRKADTLSATIELPEGLEGVFVRQGKEYPLKAGKNKLEV